MKRRCTVLVLFLLTNAICSAATVSGGSSGTIYKHVAHNGTRTLSKEVNGKEIKEHVSGLLGLKRSELMGWNVRITQNTDVA